MIAVVYVKRKMEPAISIWMKCMSNALRENAFGAIIWGY